MIVLDECDHRQLDGKNVHHRRAEELLIREIDDDFGANSLTLAEVVVVPARDNRLDVTRSVLDALGVQELPFGDDAAVHLAQLRVGTGLKMPDCCVLLAAESAGGRLASFDERLINAARARQLDVISQ